MKKIALFAFGAIITLSAVAQGPVEKAQLKQVKNDKKKLKEERSERNTKIAHGKIKAAKYDQKEIRTDRKHMNATKKHLKNKGVKKPITKATGKPSINN